MLKENEKIVVPFMGGKITISAQGQFTNNDSGKHVVYGPKVDLYNITDAKGKALPSQFLAMYEAVKSHPEALLIIKDLATRE